MSTNIAAIILAKDEALTIERCLESILSQSLIRDRAGRFTILVVANGCSDNTAEVATDYFARRALPDDVRHMVIDRQEAGKSRAWNYAVHELLDADDAFVFFVDSDIEMLEADVFETMFASLRALPDKAAFVGRPIKQNERRRRRSLANRISSVISNTTRHVNAINGSLYLVRADVIREIWLPDQTPGEDGFLNAMIETRGFTSDGRPSLVVQSTRPTHVYEDISFSGFVAHERRMIVGTVINNWLCEHLWSLKLTAPAGAEVRTWNASRPDWVQDVIESKVGRRRWVLPRSVVLRRFGTVGAIGLPRWMMRFPFALAASLVSLPSMIAANRLLRRRGAASHW